MHVKSNEAPGIYYIQNPNVGNLSFLVLLLKWTSLFNLCYMTTHYLYWRLLRKECLGKKEDQIRQLYFTIIERQKSKVWPCLPVIGGDPSSDPGGPNKEGASDKELRPPPPFEGLLGGEDTGAFLLKRKEQERKT